MPVSRRLRFEILRRDNYTCRYCGAQAPAVKLTVDHVIPTTLGGGDDPTNLVAACHDCNAGKSSIAPDAAIVADVDATAMLFAKAIERVTAQRRQELAALDATLAEFDRLWSGWTYTDSGEPIPRDDDWRESVTRFLEHGLNLTELERLIRGAMHHRARYPFRYFCWLAWREIGERQEAARRLIEDGQV